MTKNLAKNSSRLPAAPQLLKFAGDVTAQRLDKMVSYSDEVRKGEDPEAIHQMRVWSRRSRAALEIFRCCYSGRRFEEIELRVKRVTDALSAARDLDVMIEGLLKRAEPLPETERSGVASFIACLRERRAAIAPSVDQAVSELERFEIGRQFARLRKDGSLAPIVRKRVLSAGRPTPRRTATAKRIRTGGRNRG